MSSAGSSRAAYLRNFIFGVEDSLVSTVGLLSGIAVAGVSREDLFLTGVVLIFVEAISMAAGSFLSESSAEELATRKDTPSKRSYAAAGIMFVSYFISGFIPLAPYMLFGESAFVSSIAVSLLALAALGAIGARLSKVPARKTMLRMLVVGGLAIAAGVIIGAWIG
jgi:VIT1/CCC1 family predicted Fe2+/Mn2+ transporter